MKPEMLVWAEPLERQHLRLLPGDIKHALAWFREKIEQEATLIIINPRNEHLAKEAGESIEVECSGGCLRGEVWLSSEGHFAKPLQHTRAKICPEKTQPIANHTEKQKSVLLRTKTAPAHTYQNPSEDRPKVNVGGRPKKDVPVKLIHKLSKQGLSIRQIVRELKEYKISAMTISRILSGERKQP